MVVLRGKRGRGGTAKEERVWWYCEGGEGVVVLRGKRGRGGTAHREGESMMALYLKRV